MLTFTTMLHMLFSRIRREGAVVAHAANYPKFGGIWASDRWELNGVTASLEDDGMTIAVIQDGKRVSQTASLDLVFSNGATERWLADLMQKLMVPALKEQSVSPIHKDVSEITQEADAAGDLLKFTEEQRKVLNTMLQYAWNRGYKKGYEEASS